LWRLNSGVLDIRAEIIPIFSEKKKEPDPDNAGVGRNLILFNQGMDAPLISFIT
jgi:hypothetical protein